MSDDGWIEEDPQSAERLEHSNRAFDRDMLRWLLWIFAFVIVAAAGAFGWKIYEFAHDLTDNDGLRFAGAHLLTYCLVAGGFFSLLIYGFLSGHYTDIEKPKYDLLDQERRHDLRDFA